MKVSSKLIAVALGSAILGVAGGSFLRAQTAVPAAYLIAEVQVTDPDGWKQYLAALPATLAPFHEKTLARSPAVALDTSTPSSGAVAILAFNSMDDLKAWWNSPAYQAIIPLREKSAKSRVYAVQGLPPS
jgi:uncharacterized protein (DUF1330 family)